MREEGYTLLEVVIATTIIGIVFTTIFTLFNLGFSTWERVEIESELNQQWRVLKRHLEEDIHQIFISKLHPDNKFRGNYRELSWMIVGEDELKEVIYSFDQEGITKEVLSQSEEELIKEIEFFTDLKVQGSEIKVEFYSSEYGWQNSWSYQDSHQLPKAIRLDIISEELDLAPIMVEVYVGRKY